MQDMCLYNLHIDCYINFCVTSVPNVHLHGMTKSVRATHWCIGAPPVFPALTLPLLGSLDSLDTRFWNRSAKHEHRLDELEERTSSNEAWIHTTVDDSRAAEAGHYRWWAGTNAMLNALDFRTTEITNTASATDTRLSAALQHFSQGWTRLTRAERLLRRQATTLAALQHYSSAKRTCNRRHRLAFRQSKGSSHGVQSCRRPGAQPARSVQQCRRRTARPAALYRRQRSPVSQTEASPVQTNWAALGRQLAAAMEQRDKQQQLRSLGLTHPDDLALARGVMWQLKVGLRRCGLHV